MVLAAVRPLGSVPAALLATCAAAGAAVAAANAGREAALVALVAVLALALLVAVQRGAVSGTAAVLVVLLSANYNLLVNYNAFIDGALPAARLITPLATAGLCAVALAQEGARRRRGVLLRPSAADALVGLLLVAATAAFVHGTAAGNPLTFVLGDYGQLVQVAAAYAAVRLFWLNAGDAAMRSLLLLLCLSWGLRAAAEFVLPSQRGVWTIVLEGETLFRRTDTLGPLTVPLMLALGLGERRPGARLLVFACLALVGLQNVLGFTRAHYLALVLVLPLTLLAALARREARRRALVLILVSATGCVLAFASLPGALGAARQSWQRFVETFDAGTHSRLHREAETRLVFRQIEASPLTGRGLGAVYDGIDPLTLRREEAHFIHNDYLAFWLRGGLPLLVVWLALLAWAVLRGFGGGRAGLGAMVAAGAASGILAQAIASLPSGPAFGYIAGPVLALLLVLATARVEDVRREAALPTAAPRPRPSFQAAAVEAAL